MSSALKWGPGPWQHEPDELVFEYKGVLCKIQRNMSLGNLLGYVYITDPLNLYRLYNHLIKEELEVYGGVTYLNHTKEHTIVGFDCAHGYDLVPAFADMGFKYSSRENSYKTIAFVKAELEKLVDQIINF